MEYKKLEPEFKAKWIAALRSGEYKQGMNWLLKEDKYCCLGVAGAICNISTNTLESHSTLSGSIDFAVIPRTIKGNAVPGSAVSFLTSRNDGNTSSINPNGEKWDFNQIADWIEENL